MSPIVKRQALVGSYLKHPHPALSRPFTKVSGVIWFAPGCAVPDNHIGNLFIPLRAQGDRFIQDRQIRRDIGIATGWSRPNHEVPSGGNIIQNHVVQASPFARTVDYRLRSKLFSAERKHDSPPNSELPCL